jgi:hypothetical protein
MSLIISAIDLEAKGACPQQLAKFRDLFGNGPVTVTRACCVKYACAFDWDDWDWAADHFLSEDAQEVYYYTKMDYYHDLRAREKAPVDDLEVYSIACAISFYEAIKIKEE